MRIEVIIPTVPGRERYLSDAIESCLAQSGDVDFTVLVSNNGGSQVTKRAVEGFADRRIRLVEPDRFLPMPLHWDFALRQSVGEIISFIGDDDALMPGALKKVQDFFAEHRDIPALTHFPGQYYWPDYLDEGLRNRFLAKRGDGSIEVRKSGEALAKVLAFEEPYGSLPLLYHGFVRRNLLSQIAGIQGGNVFIKAAPDIFSDLALAAATDSYAVMSDCLSLGGQGAKSTGANFAKDTAEGAKFLSEMPSNYLTPFNSRCLTFYMYDYFSTVASIYGIEEHRPKSWRRFIDSVCREAVLLPRKTANEIAMQMVQIANLEFDWIGRSVAFLAAALVRFPLTAWSAALLLRRRQRHVLEKWRSAADFGATSTWQLAQWLESHPEAW